jgi:ubiquinone biosynthesis protein
MWEVAQPVVEDYVRSNLGPRAVMRDLMQTARVLARFGPKLPALAEAALIQAGNPDTDRRSAETPRPTRLWLMLGALAVFAAGLGIGAAL